MRIIQFLLLAIISFLSVDCIYGQSSGGFIFTKGDHDISTITIGSTHCMVVEYPEFLVLHEIPRIPSEANTSDTDETAAQQRNPLMVFIDSIYHNKPIKYILNSHSHGHSLSTVVPFLDEGAVLVTSHENIESYDKRGLFGDKTSKGYASSIIPISKDTVLLSDTPYPIEVLYLSKTEYKHIPTPSYLFFHFSTQKLLATSCMVYLNDYHENLGFRGTIYSGRITDVNDLVVHKNLDVENTMQLYNFRYKDKKREMPLYSMSYLRNVIQHGWSRQELVDHFIENVSLAEMTTKQDSLLDYFVELGIYTVITNRVVYELIEKGEYAKAVAFAKLQLLYRPDSSNFIDTMGEAYFNNDQLDLANRYSKILERIVPDEDGLGLAVWEKNRKDRLEKSTE